MKVLFWNTQRLGGGSPDDKQQALLEAVLNLKEGMEVDICLFCEITSDVEAFALAKQVAVVRRDVRRNAAQLGYGCLDCDLSHRDLRIAEIPHYNDVFDEPIGYRGGGRFDAQSKRRVAFAGRVGNVPLYVYHANASYKSVELVRWIACALDERHKRFLLVGDFNCAPASLREALSDKLHLLVKDGGCTHIPSGARTAKSVLDYAVAKGCSITVEVLPADKIVRGTGWKRPPDHLPILVTVG